MFDVGDKVVCIRKPIGRGQVSRTMWIDVATLPQVGCVYTVNSVHKHPFEDLVGITLVEMPKESPSGNRWIFEDYNFRKVQEIEEPKRVVRREKVPELV